jgi:hypothetical protein
MYDVRTKSPHYRRIDTLKNLVLINQDEPRVEAQYRQPDGSWAFRELTGLDEVLVLEALDVRLPLREIYDRVEFPQTKIE